MLCRSVDGFSPNRCPSRTGLAISPTPERIVEVRDRGGSGREARNTIKSLEYEYWTQEVVEGTGSVVKILRPTGQTVDSGRRRGLSGCTPRLGTGSLKEVVSSPRETRNSPRRETFTSPFFPSSAPPGRSGRGFWERLYRPYAARLREERKCRGPKGSQGRVGLRATVYVGVEFL